VKWERGLGQESCKPDPKRKQVPASKGKKNEEARLRTKISICWNKNESWGRKRRALQRKRQLCKGGGATRKPIMKKGKKGEETFTRKKHHATPPQSKKKKSFDKDGPE